MTWSGGHDEGEDGCYETVDCDQGDRAPWIRRRSSYQLHLWSSRWEGTELFSQLFELIRQLALKHLFRFVFYPQEKRTLLTLDCS